MIKKIFKLIIFFLFIISGAFLWSRGKHPSYYLNLKWDELDSQTPHFHPSRGVLIIFNSGGWGNTTFEDAEDFAKVLRGIKLTINKLGWKTVILSYGRTKDNLLGRIWGMKEILSSFRSQSKKLAKQMNIVLEHNPGSRVLITGLSLGANFVGETMKKVGKNPSVLAIKAGTPFWAQGPKMENVLELTNEKDILAAGNYKIIVGVGVKGLVGWAKAKIMRRKLSLSSAIHLPGHRYDWKFPWVREEITSFLKNNLKESR